jgi:hypothetical protein
MKKLSIVSETQERVQASKPGPLDQVKFECRAKMDRTSVNNAVGGPERGNKEVALNRELRRDVNVVQDFLDALGLRCVRQRK